MRLRKFLLLVCAMLVMFVGVMYAVGTEQTVSVKVTITAGVSVSISGSTDYQFGALPTSAITFSNSAVVVSNDSTSANEKYALKAGDSASWYLSSAPGVSNFEIRAIFKTAAGTTADFVNAEDELTSSNQTCSASLFALNGDGPEVKGYAVTPAGQRNLWFLLSTPTSITQGSGVEQIIPVTITVSYAD